MRDIRKWKWSNIKDKCELQLWANKFGKPLRYAGWTEVVVSSKKVVSTYKSTKCSTSRSQSLIIFPPQNLQSSPKLAHLIWYQLTAAYVVMLDNMKKGITFVVIGELDTGGWGLSSPTFSPSAELESSPQWTTIELLGDSSPWNNKPSRYFADSWFNSIF